MPADSIFKDDLYKGKVVFATGGGTGIVYGMVEALMAHGCDAVILGRRQEVITTSAKRLSETTGKRCIGVAGDVRSPESLKGAVAQAIKEFGRLDYVIAGAAGNFLAPISGISENAFQTVMSIDTLGTFNTLKATIGEVRKTKGAYLAISATLHYKGAYLQAHVSAAKAGVDALIRVFAVEEGPFGVRANIIAPGPIADTEGMARLLPKAETAAMEKRIPLQAMGKVKDIADAGLYLFSPAAKFITASCLVVDGGAFHTSGAGSTYPDGLFDKDFRKTMASKL